MTHRDKLQKQLNEYTAQMPIEQKMALSNTISRMPIHKQEQYIAELVAKAKRREGMTQEERFNEDEENRELTESF